MDDQKRGDDAADHAPKSTKGECPGPPGKKHEAGNEEPRPGGKAVETEDLSSANDQGAA